MDATVGQPEPLSRRDPGANGRALGNRPGQSPYDRVSRSLVFVSPSGMLPECIVTAVEREFPWLDVELVPELGGIDAEFDSPVALFLVDHCYLSQLDDQMKRCRDRHPRAVAAVMFDDMAGAASYLQHIRRSDSARGVVLMNVKLDVWLSALDLLLRGGEHLPTSLLKYCPQAHVGSPAVDFASPAASGGDADGRTETALADLTPREQEVVAFVASGAQNKEIAARLSLSEHTVKIHVGNVIRKLQASNRTEAAATYLHLSAAAGGPASAS